MSFSALHCLESPMGYTASGRSGRQGSAGKQPERQLRGQNQRGRSHSPLQISATGIGNKALNPRGLGTESPGSVPFCLSLVSSVPLIQRFRSFVGTHISALNFRMSLFRWLGVAINFRLLEPEPLRAYPCVDERTGRFAFISGSRYTSCLFRTHQAASAKWRATATTAF